GHDRVHRMAADSRHGRVSEGAVRFRRRRAAMAHPRRGVPAAARRRLPAVLARVASGFSRTCTSGPPTGGPYFTLTPAPTMSSVVRGLPGNPRYGEPGLIA